VNATWYDVLGLEPTATTDEIRAAWRAAVADLDPTDRRFRVANQAAEVLLDPEHRAAYDAELPVDDDPAREPEPAVGLEPIAATDVEPDGSVVALADGRGLPTPGFLVPGWLLIGLAVLTATALVVVGVLLTKPSDSTVVNDTSAAQAAAERAVVPILSYDAHHLDESQAQATPYLTDAYRAQYDKLFAVIRQNAPRTGTVVKAKYLASGIVRSGAGRVDVLVFVNQVTYNLQHPKTPVIYKNQATVTMEKVGNNWLVDNMVTNQSGA
jgi:Mce-associated membrane protein